MFESRTIYSKRYPREENYEELNKLENEERLLETDAKLEKFKRYIQSIRYQVIPEKMAGRQEFISLAVDLSETFSVDMDIKEKAYGIEVSLHMFCSAYPDIMTQMLAKLFNMSDTSASFILPDKPGDFTLVFDYRTHDSYVDEQS